MLRTGTAVRGPDENPISADPAIRRKGVEANKRNLDCCAAAGCEVMAGPFHSALGYFSGKGPTADEWKWGVESMREVAEHAEKVGVTLGLEYLNRFECYFLNTAADGARFCREVNHPRCKMMYDTFHAHIEEKNIPQAIRALKDCLVHVHISENDRSTPGNGNVRWAENFDTLHEIGYDSTDGHRGLRPGPGEARRRHEDLAPDVRQRTAIGRRRARVHEGGGRQALEVAASPEGRRLSEELNQRC